MAVVGGEREREREREKEEEEEEEVEEIIPGLPNEIAELCLLHLPYPYQALSRSVSSTWNRAITHPSFKNKPSHPHLFVLAFHSKTATFRCQALDPSSGRWFLLPQIPLPEKSHPTAFASARGKLFVMCAAGTTLAYSAATNRWGRAAGMPEGRGELVSAAGVEGGRRVVAVGRGGTNIYDPESDTWREGRRLERQLERYEVVSVGGRVYVTEGWWWPFMFRPRGWVYEVERDTWREMGIGMREGWSGVGVAVAGRVFVIAEFGDSPVKVYEEEWDTWRSVGGGRFPRELLKRPFSATAFDDRIYVASSGLNVAIGTVVLNASATATAADVLLTWQVVEAPRAFRELSPSASQVLYA